MQIIFHVIYPIFQVNKVSVIRRERIDELVLQKTRNFGLLQALPYLQQQYILLHSPVSRKQPQKTHKWMRVVVFNKTSFLNTDICLSDEFHVSWIISLCFSMIWKCKNHSRLAGHTTTGGGLESGHGLPMPKIKDSLTIRFVKYKTKPYSFWYHFRFSSVKTERTKIVFVV